MGEPLRIEPVSPAPWMSLEPKRILLLCAQTDRPIVELVGPPLAFQGVRVDVVPDAFDSHTVGSALAAAACPTVVAVVVSHARTRSAARPLLDAFSEVTGPYNRLFVLDLRRRASLMEQVRSLCDAIEGLRSTLAIGRESRAALTMSASIRPQASGGWRLSPSGAGTRRLHVVDPPVLLGPSVHWGSLSISVGTRFRMNPRVRGRDSSPTSPDLPVID